MGLPLPLCYLNLFSSMKCILLKATDFIEVVEYVYSKPGDQYICMHLVTVAHKMLPETIDIEK